MNETLLYLAGRETTQCLNISIIADEILEGSKMLLLLISLPDDLYQLRLWMMNVSSSETWHYNPFLRWKLDWAKKSDYSWQYCCMKVPEDISIFSWHAVSTRYKNKYTLNYSHNISVSLRPSLYYYFESTSSFWYTIPLHMQLFLLSTVYVQSFSCRSKSLIQSAILYHQWKWWIGGSLCIHQLGIRSERICCYFQSGWHIYL